MQLGLGLGFPGDPRVRVRASDEPGVGKQHRAAALPFKICFLQVAGAGFSSTNEDF